MHAGAEWRASRAGGDVVVSPRNVQLGVMPVPRGHCFMLQGKEDREPQGRGFLLQEHRVNYAVIIITRYDLFLLDPVPGWLVRLGRGALRYSTYR